MNYNCWVPLISNSTFGRPAALGVGNFLFFRWIQRMEHQRRPIATHEFPTRNSWQLASQWFKWVHHWRLVRCVLEPFSVCTWQPLFRHSTWPKLQTQLARTPCLCRLWSQLSIASLVFTTKTSTWSKFSNLDQRADNPVLPISLRTFHTTRWKWIWRTWLRIRGPN